MGTQLEEETLTLEEVLAALKVSHRLILWNDDTNTFEHVIHCSDWRILNELIIFKCEIRYLF